MKAKWFRLWAALFGGAMLLQVGCFSFEDFWQGLWNTGWPTDVRWLNIAWDILNEELFG